MNKMFKENEIFLKDNLFLGGDEPSFEDAEFFKYLIKNNKKPEKEEYPSIWAWYSIMILFEDEIIKELLKHPNKNINKKKINSFNNFICDEPDDYDINKCDKNIIKEKRNKHKDEISIIFLRINPENIDVDLNLLAKKIKKEIKRDGLIWNEKYEIKEYEFGIKKLIIGMNVKMDTSVQDIIDQLETWEEEIQSVDFVLFTQKY